MIDARVDLQQEIIMLREKLDNMLDDKPVSCMEVQKISIKLDKLITKYYLQKKNHSFNTGR